ncbi:hypothetical protein NDU88_003017 [Pleurodeles waltl]|uniref:Pre-C2HC domain-containing protein n=1 Tax=Pleurodeles waltl TaxID=8319 RepID=A0AAV7NFE6_PLEWA|nr:hypothetical protein NDU88_003017 [Pleurodeles waltl]
MEADALAHPNNTEDMVWHAKVKRGRDSCQNSPEKAPKLARAPAGSSAIPTANRFQVLQNAQDSDSHPQDHESTEPENSSGPTKRLRIPPIILKNLATHKVLVELLEEHCTSTFTIKPRQDHAKIILTTPDDYRIVTSILTEQKMEYHTFSLTTVKAQRFVIRGLPANASLGHITEDLAELGLPVKNITQITSPADTNKKFPLFIVTLSQGHDGKPADLSTVTRLCSCTVTTEAPRGKRGPIMCYNCQRLGHTSTFCHQKPRCVRCGGEHTSNKCTRNRETEPAICANCTGNHPASYRGCPYLQKAKKDEQRKQLPQPQKASRHPPAAAQGHRKTNNHKPETAHRITIRNPTNTHSEARVDGRTYAEVTGPKQDSPPPTTAPGPTCETGTAINWQELIMKIAKTVADMNIHPVVTMVANLIAGLFHSEENTCNGN